MKNSKVLKTFLIISGSWLSFVGGATLFMPVKMRASMGIDIAENINLINDARASFALLLAIGILTILGAFKDKLAYTSTLVVSILFLSLGAGRLLSILLDGMPIGGLVGGTIVEFVFGTIAVTLFVIYREKNSSKN